MTPDTPPGSVGAWLAYFGVKIASLVAGFLGASVALSYMPTLTWLQMLAAILAGASVAAYGEPLVSYALDVPGQVQPAVAFFVGLGGMTIGAGVIKFAGSLPEIAKGWIERRKGGQP